MNGPVYTSLATLGVASVNFDVHPVGITTRTVLADSFGAEFAFTGSPQEWLDFAMRIARQIHEHADRLTAEQLDGGASEAQRAEQARAEIRQILNGGVTS